MSSAPQAAPVAAVVLVGGASRRMGRDKATLPYRGATLIEQVISAVRPRCTPVFVIAARGQALPAVDAEIVRDDANGVGPLAATGRGLRAAADTGASWAFVCAVDMPFLDADLVDVLMAAARSLTADVVLPWDGRDHYLAGLYRTELADRADDLVASGARSMAALVNAVEAQRIVMDGWPWLVNVNSPADLAASR